MGEKFPDAAAFLRWKRLAREKGKNVQDLPVYPPAAKLTYYCFFFAYNMHQYYYYLPQLRNCYSHAAHANQAGGFDNFCPA